ncbi:MAG: hypothetical protein M1482_18205 [Chloroflexi bacterium]|nr:hypothetical protein [Chloroflexota bacterium]
MSASFDKAKKHVRISNKVKQIAESLGYADHVYAATHAFGQMAKVFHEAELESGEQFWSIKAWKRAVPRARGLKNPDLVITDTKRVMVFVEVKWGTVAGPDTDLRLGLKDVEKLRCLLRAQSVFCNINGPVGELPAKLLHREFSIDEQTQFILVTDIPTAPKLRSHLDRWDEIGFLVTDIEKCVGRFRPVRDELAKRI